MGEYRVQGGPHAAVTPPQGSGELFANQKLPDLARCPVIEARAFIPGCRVLEGAEDHVDQRQVAERAILDKGYVATSIEEIISEAGITKSGFFYHFKDKLDLARALLVRYVEQDTDFFGQLFERADELSDDPLQSFLIFLKMYAENLEHIEVTHPGCLIASYCYQENQFDDNIRGMMSDAMLSWRTMFKARLEAIAKKYPPRQDVDLDDLADTVSTMMEGGIIMVKVMKDAEIMGRQTMIFRTLVKPLFEPA